MEQYHVTGMSCAACSSRVEKAVSKVPGVESCSVSLLTNSMGVEGTASPEAVIAAVEAAGYGASCKGRGAGTSSGSGNGAPEAAARSGSAGRYGNADIKETAHLVHYIFSCAYVFFHGAYDGDGRCREAMAVNHVAMGLCSRCLTAAVMVINQKFFISGFRSWHRAPNRRIRWWHLA